MLALALLIHGATSLQAADPQIIDASLAPTNLYYGDPQDLSSLIVSDSGLPVTLTIDAGSSTGTAATSTLVAGILTCRGIGVLRVIASQAGDASYLAAIDVPFNITLSPRPLTVTANQRSKSYGAALPTFTYTVVGLVFADTAATVLSGALATTGLSSSPVSTYPITIGSLASIPNYAVSYTGNNLNVLAAPLTVTASPQYMIYGNTLPALTYSYNGLTNGDSAAVFTGTLTTSPTPINASTSVGFYDILQGSVLAGANYTVAFTGAKVYVVQASATVSLSAPAPVVYDGLQHALTPSVSGSPTPTATVTYQMTAPTAGSATTTAPTNVGTYTVTATVDANHAATPAITTQTITPAAGTVLLADLTVFYDGTPKSITPSVSGAGTTSASVTYQGYTGDPSSGGTLTGSPSATVPTNAGWYQAVASIDGNHTSVTSTKLLTIQPASYAVVFGSTSVTYDGQTHSVSPTNSPSVTTTVTYQPWSGNPSSGGSSTGGATSTAPSQAGWYKISATSDGNHTPVVTTGSLQINKAVLTVTGAPQTIIFGDAIPSSYTAQYIGLVPGDNGAAIVGSLTWITSPVSPSNVGIYLATPSGPTTATNYSISYQATTLTISAAPATIVLPPAQAVTYSGAPHSVTPTSVTSGAMATVIYQPYDSDPLVFGAISTGSATATAPTNAGWYVVTATVDSDHTLAPVTATSLHIVPAALSVTCDSTTISYGTEAPSSYTPHYSAFKGSDSAASLSGTLVFTLIPSAANPPEVGPYTAVPSGLSSPNYTISYGTSPTLTVSPADVSVAIPATTSVFYNTLTHPVPVAVSPSSVPITILYQAYDQSPSTGGVLVGVPSSSPPTNVGYFAVTATADGNYHPVYTTGVLTINPTMLIVKATDAHLPYGTSLATIGYNCIGFLGSDSIATSLTGELESSKTISSPVGSYLITQGTLVATNGNYSIDYQSGSIYVEPATLTITAHAKAMIVGGSAPTLTYDVSGIIAPDDDTILVGSLASEGTPGTDVGKFPITIGTLSAGGNYTIGLVGNYLTVTVNPVLNITAVATGRAYGSDNPALTYTVTGFLGTDDDSAISGALSCSADTTSPPGTYPIALGDIIVPAYYQINYTSANLTVNKAILTVSADPQAKVYGAVMPALTYSYSGLVAGDTDTIITGSMTTSATASSAVGSYPTTIGSLAAGGNYTIAFTGANFTVTAAPLTIKADNKSVAFNTAIPSLTYSIVGLVNGDGTNLVTGTPTLSTVAASTSPIGTYPITIAVTGVSAANYAVTGSDGVLTITFANSGSSDSGPYSTSGGGCSAGSALAVIISAMALLAPTFRRARRN